MANPTGEILVRPESAFDKDNIYHLTQRAFQGKSYSDGDEQDLVDALRNQGALTLSLVATQSDVIIGHVAFSPAFAENRAEGWYTLGPISVDPNKQRQGIGGMLIRGGLTRLVAMQARGCIVLGDTGYYTRHDFVPRPDLAPNGEPQAHYMVQSLDGHVPTTVVSFHPAFYGLSA